MSQEKEFLYPGTIVNPNEKIACAIRKRLVVTEGECPCDQGDVPVKDKMCPCKSYRTDGYCCCRLYVPDIETVKIEITNNGTEYTSNDGDTCKTSSIDTLEEYMEHLKSFGKKYIIKRR